MFDTLCHNMKNLKSRNWHGWLLKNGVNIELLCQDSVIRGCWLRCTVLEISQEQMKVKHDDVDDDDGCGKLEEWIRPFRQAAPDRLGMSCAGRIVIRPQPLHDDVPNSIEAGVPVDAWWSDGWWEGVVTGVTNNGEKLKVYIPSENLSIDVLKKDVRVSRDWVDGKWVDLRSKSDILSVIPCLASADAELPMDPTIARDTDGDKNCTNDLLPMEEENPQQSEEGAVLAILATIMITAIAIQNCRIIATVKLIVLLGLKTKTMLRRMPIKKKKMKRAIQIQRILELVYR